MFLRTYLFREDTLVEYLSTKLDQLARLMLQGKSNSCLTNTRWAPQQQGQANNNKILLGQTTKTSLLPSNSQLTPEQTKV